MVNLCIKFGSLPGDISLDEKIAMYEGKHPDKKRSKSFRKEVRMSEKAINKEYVREFIKSELEEYYKGN